MEWLLQQFMGQAILSPSTTYGFGMARIHHQLDIYKFYVFMCFRHLTTFPKNKNEKNGWFGWFRTTKARSVRTKNKKRIATPGAPTSVLGSFLAKRMASS